MTITLRWIHALYAAIVLVVALFLFWLIAPYPIAASIPHLPGVSKFLHSYMHNAVRNRSFFDRAPDYLDLDDPALKRLGAGHFASACAVCHGSPGVDRNPVALSMKPAPTDLAEPHGLSAAEYHHIGYNGIKYSGMPAWTGDKRQDEVWAIAAFLQDYATLDAESYRQLAFGEAKIPGQAEGTAQKFGMLAGDVELMESCARCHGTKGLGRDGTAPRLAGQSRTYLLKALEAYAEGRRESGFMEAIAVTLQTEEREKLAQAYSELPGLPAPRMGDPTIRTLGQTLAEDGFENRDIPACFGCHGPRRKDEVPIIIGQDERWIATWLHLWRDFPNPAVGDGDKMHAAARNLTDEDIREVSAYLSGNGITAAPSE